MSAKKKAIIAVIVGAVIGAIIAFVLWEVYGSMFRDDSEKLIALLYIPTTGALYAFGFAFGWKRGKGIVAKMAGVAAEVTFFALIVHLIRGKGFLAGLIIATLLISLGFSIVWMMGIPLGIKDIVTESRAAA